MTLDEYTQIMDDIGRYRADCEFVNEYEESECRRCNANVFDSIERMIEKHKGDGWHTEPPEESGEYYVTWTSDDRKRAVGICEYEIDESVPDGMWWPETYMKSYPGWKVVAWMPLPDAYKEVEQMRIQRKLLTKKQRQQICEKHSEVWQEDGKRYCTLECPLRADISNGIGGKMDRSCKQISIIEKSIEKYWNEEIKMEGE